MKKKVLLSLTALLLVFAVGCGKVPKLKDGAEIVASIDGTNVTADDIYKELRKKYGIGIVVNKVDRAIAEKELGNLEQYEDKAKAAVEATETQYKEAGQDFLQALLQAGYEDAAAYQEDVMLGILREEIVKKYIGENLDEKQINKYYDEEIYGDITVRHILIKPDVETSATDEEKKVAEQKAKKDAMELITKLNAGEKFEDLAKVHSDDGTAKDGGLFADFNKQGVVPEFWDASYKLKDGELSKEPVKTEYGYHIILRVSAKAKPTLKDVKDDVVEALVASNIAADDTVMDKSLDKIRKKHKFNIVDTDINNNYKKVIDSLYQEQN